MTGQSATWHGCGSLRLAYNEDELDWLKYTRSLGHGLGYAMEIVGPDGPIAVLTPEAGTSDVVELEATTEPIQSATWCYVRGVDETGGMAWSSPVWMIPE